MNKPNEKKEQTALAKKDFKSEELLSLKEWGKFAKYTGIVPANVNEYQAMAIVQTGREMKLQPLESLRMMTFIRGRVCMLVQLQLALAMKRCGVKIKAIDSTDNYCTVTLSREGYPDMDTGYNLEDAKRAGLIKEDSGWEKNPRQMMRWRAIGDGLRLIAPDLTMGIISPEEGSMLPPVETTITDVTDPKGKPEVKMPEPITPLPANKDKVEYIDEEDLASLKVEYIDEEDLASLKDALKRASDAGIREADLFRAMGVKNLAMIPKKKIVDAFNYIKEFTQDEG